jgi:hypothetical protein
MGWKYIVGKLVSYLIKKLTKDQIKEFLDHGLDWIEDKIEDSSTEWDDKLLPAIKTLREAVNIPDDD